MTTTRWVAGGRRGADEEQSLLDDLFCCFIFSIPPPLQMCDFIEGNYLHEQVDAIKELAGHCTNLKRVGPGHGEYHFDRETLDD